MKTIEYHDNIPSSPKYSKQTLHNSLVRVRYGMSFVSSESDLWVTFVILVLYVMLHFPQHGPISIQSHVHQIIMRCSFIQNTGVFNIYQMTKHIRQHNAVVQRISKEEILYVPLLSDHLTFLGKLTQIWFNEMCCRHVWSEFYKGIFLWTSFFYRIFFRIHCRLMTTMNQVINASVPSGPILIHLDPLKYIPMKFQSILKIFNERKFIYETLKLKNLMKSWSHFWSGFNVLNYVWKSC